ncbi:MAG: restriction endonuclease [Azospirillaceae bacterium]|nr:restriction endonuclease [Azospirillaceae bacterium]
MSAEWKEFELAVTELCKAIAPDAKVTHDAMIPDIDTGSPRQRDVWIETRIGGHFSVKILVSCKNYTRKVNVQQVDAFIGELASSGANVGVIYSASGFTKDALAKTKRRGISACILLANQPPPVPNVITVEVYFLDERIHLVAQGVTGPVNWPDLLNADGEIDGKTMPAHQAIATLFSRDSPALWPALSGKVMPVRLSLITLQAAASAEAISVGVESQWVVYRARAEAWLVNGSYNFTGGDFKGSFSTPSIDTWSSDPGPGWEPIGADEIGGGSAIKLYRAVRDIAPLLAAMASGAPSVPDRTPMA